MTTQAPPSERLEWAGKAIPYTRIAIQTFQSVPDAIRTGPDGGVRTDQQGIVKALIGDFSAGGLFKARGDWQRDINRYDRNEGLMTHIPGLLTLPYILTTQTAITGAADPSGYRAANTRVHAETSSLGASGQRFYAGIGVDFLRDTSLTDPAIARVEAAANKILCLRELVKNSAVYLVRGTDGTTNDAEGTLDPTASPPVWANWFALSAGDRVEGMESWRNLGGGFNTYMGQVGAVAGLFYDKHSDALGTAPRALVATASRAVANPSNAVETQTRSPTVQQETDNGGGAAWTTPNNIKASDNAYATIGGSSTSDFLWMRGFGFNVPAGALVQGIEVLLEGNKTAGNAVTPTLQLILAGAVIGDAKTAANLNDTTDTTQTIPASGGATDYWGYLTDLAASDINDANFGVRLFLTTGAGQTAALDHLQIRVSFIPPGAQASLPLGGYDIRKSPSVVNRWGLVAPVRSETGAVTLPRRLWFADLSYDTDGDRPTVSLSQPNTGLSHVEHACWHSGGVLVAGDNSSGIGKSVKIIDSNGDPWDTGFLKGDGYESDVGAAVVSSAGRVAICEVAWADGTETQWWFYFDGTWHASTPLQTKSDATISGIPIAWGAGAVNVQQQYRYRFFPRSAALAAAREFQPRNMFEDPLRNNTSIAKQDGPLYLRMPRLNWGGAFEANKALLAVQYGSREATNNAATYGQVLFDFVTDGDTAFASPEVANTFDSDYEDYEVLSSGAAFRDGIVRIGLDRGATTTVTPNGLPILLTMAVEWPHMSLIDVYLDMKQVISEYGHLTNFLAVLRSASTTGETYEGGGATLNGRVSQRLRWGVFDEPCVFKGIYDAAVPAIPVGVAPKDVGGRPYLRFLEVKGRTASA